MALIDRTGAGSLIPEDYVGELMKAVFYDSVVMRTFRHIRMKARVQRQSVLSGLATAGWVSPADTGLKPTSAVSWKDKTITAEALACIVPIPEEVMADASVTWDDIKPYMAEALAVAIDDAVLFGTNAPATFPTSVVASAIAASNQVVAGTSAIDTFDDINAAMGLIEAEGFFTDSIIARMQWRAKLRGARDAQKGFLFPPAGPRNVGIGSTDQADWPGEGDASILGEPAYFNRAGLSSFATGAANYSAVGLDSDNFVLGIRQDMTYQVLTEATLFNTDGSVMFALPQQDMVALRVVCRMGWVTPNPINRLQQTEANRFPAWVLKQKASTGGE
jgi:HK97 family phage major capsid protein